MRFVPFGLLACLIATPVNARDLLKTLADQPSSIVKTSNHPDLKFCVITALANRTGQASTVVDKGADTIVVVHNWSSAVPGDDARAIFTIKADGTLEFRGQKRELLETVAPCTKL